MNYNSLTDTAPEKRTEFIAWLTQNTLTELELARHDSQKLHAAVRQFISLASSANLDVEEMENILGVDDACIMDLAELSETDENIVVDSFEQLTNT